MADCVRRQVMEWEFTTSRTCDNPFADVTIDGEGIFRLRFDPVEVGTWQVKFAASGVVEGGRNTSLVEQNAAGQTHDFNLVVAA